MASTSKTIAELISSDLTVDVANTDIVGVITDNQIAAISNTKITGTLNAPQIADAAITPAKLCQTFLTPTGDGSGLTGLAAGGFSNMCVFTGPGQFNAPPSSTKVKVTVVGGGGGGGCISTVLCSIEMEGSQCLRCILGPFAPGSGGGTAIKIMPVTGGSPYAVTVGAGGGSMATGGTSTFAGPVTVSATGGGGGVSTSAGTGSGGDFNFKGVTYSCISGSSCFGVLSERCCAGVCVACTAPSTCKYCACSSPVDERGYGVGGTRAWVTRTSYCSVGSVPADAAGGQGTPGIVIVEY